MKNDKNRKLLFSAGGVDLNDDAAIDKWAQQIWEIMNANKEGEENDTSQEQ